MATQVLETQVLRRQAEAQASRDGTWKTSMTILLGVALGLSIAIAVLYLLPKVYMGPAFGNSNMTKAEVIRSLEYGRNIHVYYAGIPWPRQSLVGSQEFHRTWISTYDQAISYLKK